jgi:hypothetical protein
VPQVSIAIPALNDALNLPHVFSRLPQDVFEVILVNGGSVDDTVAVARGGGSTDITPLRRLGNRALNGLVNILYGTRYTDLCYGCNAFWRHCLDALQLHPRAEDKDAGMRWGDGFEVETRRRSRGTLSDVAAHNWLPRTETTAETAVR